MMMYVNICLPRARLRNDSPGALLSAAAARCNQATK